MAANLAARVEVTDQQAQWQTRQFGRTDSTFDDVVVFVVWQPSANGSADGAGAPSRTSDIG